MEDEKQFYSIILRHDTSTLWMTNNPILALGEYGVEDDTHKVKRGDGESKWSDLVYEDFGLTYIVTYKNLKGNVSDNEMLNQALESKVSKSVFSDTGDSVVASLLLTSGDGDVIGKITKTTKNVILGGTSMTNLVIKSNDNTIQGVWSVDESGARVLNLTAESSISDYEPNHAYYIDQLCFYNNKLYRAAENFVAGVSFNENQWVLLTSLHSNEIKYNNLLSGLDAENVKDALDELKRRDDRKVVKSTEGRIVYGTTNTGDQTVIPIDDLRKVDTINHKPADISKNVQLDANEINYSDAFPENGTIKDVLDSKVDKTVAGKGAKIVRDIQFNYNDETGNIEVIEDKVSLENGVSEKEVRVIDIVSEQELAEGISEVNERIDTEVETLNNSIINTAKQLDTKIDTEVDALETTIQENKQEINTRVDTVVETLDAKIEDTRTDLKTNIDSNKQEINTRVDSEVETLNQTMTGNVNTLNNRIDTEVETLNGTIQDEKDALNERIDTEVEDLNERIGTEVETLNGTIDNNKADIETKLSNGLNTKIDKAISTNIVTDIIASSQSKEPTIKIVRKNTETNESIVNHLHFKASGDIKTTFVDEDHILIDSSVIDEKIQDNVTHLGIVDGRLTAHDTDIASLYEHDVNHDKMLAAHTEQIAHQETMMMEHEDRLDEHDNQITDIKAVDAKQELHLTKIDGQLDIHTQQLQAQSDQIGSVASMVSSNLEKINNLTQVVADNKTETDTNIQNLRDTKAEKTFAQHTNNYVVGDISLNAITGNELLVLDSDKVSPADGSNTSKSLKIISSDNTVVSKPVLDDDGNIIAMDIATNLDIDVNYFVTSEILNTTVPSENVVTLSSLTATDKTEVELQDIISDTEGTWSRVKSIDKEAGTCVTVTYAKHAQAIWGTVKGNISEQQDLQAELNKKFTIPTTGFGLGYLTDETILLSTTGVTYNIDGTDGFCTDASFDIMSKNFKTGDTSYKTVQLSYSNSTLGNDILFKTITDGARTNFLPKVYAEKVYIDTKTSGLTNKYLSPIIRELKALDDEKYKIVSDNTNKGKLLHTIKTTDAGTMGAGLYIYGYDYDKGEMFDNHIRFTIPDLNTSADKQGIYFLSTAEAGSNNLDILLGIDYPHIQSALIPIDSKVTGLTSKYLVSSLAELKTLDDAKLIKVNTANVVYGTNADGEQTTYNKDALRTVDTVNNIAADSNKNITITGNDINLSSIDTTSIKAKVDELITTLNKMQTDLQEHISTYASDKVYKATGNYTVEKYVTITRDDGVMLMAKIAKDFTSNTLQATTFDNFVADVEAGNLVLVGIPEQTGTVVVTETQEETLNETETASSTEEVSKN